MGCESCEKTEALGMVAYYRWGKANIGIIACPKHAKEIIEALNKAQGIGTGVEQK
jgi:hypothetical protein